MPTPFDKVLTNAGVLDSQGRVTEQEKEKFIKSVEDILKKGSTLPGLEFPPDPFAEDTSKRLRESSVWKKTYVDGLLEPTIKSLDTNGNIPLFPVHDLSSTFNINIDINGLKDPTNFTPDKIVADSGMTLPEVTSKISSLTLEIPVIPPIPVPPTLPTPESLVIEKFEVERVNLEPEVDANIQVLSAEPLNFFEKLFVAPVDVFKELLKDPTGTLDSAINSTLPQKILEILIRIVKLIIAAIAAVIGAVYILIATILAWTYRMVSAIAASLISSIIGTGSISTSVYNAQISS